MVKPILFLLLLAAVNGHAQVDNTFNLMPVPSRVTVRPGKTYVDPQFRIAIKGRPDSRLYAEASRFIRRLSNETGVFLDKQGFVTPADSDLTAPALLIRVNRPGRLKTGEDESYAIRTDTHPMTVDAMTDLGAIHALETLLQLVSADPAGYYFPGVDITDRPRFVWRGLLLDVALHFMPVEVIHRTIDGMAAAKMNVLHLHLCNDQGFRVESKIFPRLQQLASDGAYYTQEEIRGIVRYAGQRGIRVVPEFVVPAHTTAILTAYPEWASAKRNYRLQRYFGVFDPVLDPTNEQLYPFLQKLFGEMASLFPDEYFHIGGDENTGKDWERNPHIRSVMHAKGMTGYMELQTWFNKRLLRIIDGLGKKMIGWDEILQPGIPNEVTIQSWRGNESFYRAVREGHQAILSYGYYIDLIQPASYHYQNDPIPDSARLTAEASRHILGGEATMWSELVTPLTVDSRIWPRTAAIAERLWSAKSVRDTDDMYRRLDIMSRRLEALGLQHLVYKQVLMRQLCNGAPVQPLETLTDVIEPLKIYERNEGDTMYTVFSPFTKLADLASPDQPEPRRFRREVDSFLDRPTPELAGKIRQRLTGWKVNDAAFRNLLAGAPALQEAAPLSGRLAELAEAGIEALDILDKRSEPDTGWIMTQREIIRRSRLQSGRCELQVVDPVQRLIEKAAGLGGISRGQNKFIQEYQEAYPVGTLEQDNDVRSIAVDVRNTVYIATRSGLYEKADRTTKWKSLPIPDSDRGPAYAARADAQGRIWLGTWKGVIQVQGDTITTIVGPVGPISVLCASTEGMYALGPKGIWLITGTTARPINYAVARSVRAAVSDRQAGLWIASDVGLYHANQQGVRWTTDTSRLISAGLKGLEMTGNGTVWVAGLGGVSVMKEDAILQKITTKEGCPSGYINCVKQAADGTMWVGTAVGVVRYYGDGHHSLRFTRRWLLDDYVNDIAFDREGNAWIATRQGVSAIRHKSMSLAEKEDYFYGVLMRRHIRAPWIAGQCHLLAPGDTTRWQPEDDDNDGEYTGNYLAMESFRYAVTHNQDAREKAKRAFHFLKQLKDVTNGDGYFARSIVPAARAERVHDGNRKYNDREVAEELVADPRYKPVEKRWHPSADGKWLWKGDASSDEWCGHMMGYFFYYELAADEDEKRLVREHVASLADHLIAHNFTMVDADGTHTHWAVWTPQLLNHDPEWAQDRYQNSMELLAFLKLAYYLTDDEKYQQHYLRLIREEHYLENMSHLADQNPAWFIYFDVTMQAYLYPILLHAEKDSVLLAFYRKSLDSWMERRRGDHNPLINFLYCYASGKRVEGPASVDFLIDTPLDLVDWPVDQGKREDVKLVHTPVLDEWQVNELPEPGIRATVRWDKNPWAASSGSPQTEKEPVFWLYPYWMGRYLNMIH
jgi:hypothetical protein